MKTSLVSIIIPTYNRAHLIAETLDSVIAQTYKNWECIVIDDGSTDDTNQIMQIYCEKDSRFKYFHRPEEHLVGGNGARNYGFKKSLGALVKWFDSDDLMHPELLEVQVKDILKDNTQLTFCNLKILNSVKRFNPLGFENIENLLKDFITRKIKINLQSILFSSNLIKKFKFDEKLRKAQDLDFIYEVLKEKPTYSYTNQNLCEIRLHNQRISEDYKKLNKETILSSIKVKEKILFNEYLFLNSKEKKKILYQYIYELRLLIFIYKIKSFFYYLNRLKRYSYINTKTYLNIIFKFSILFLKKTLKNMKANLASLKAI